jgi:hypothetical protein
VTSEIVQLDFENPRRRRVASEIIDILYFYKTGVGRPRDIITKMRFVIETYCTFTHPDFLDSDDSLSSIVEKFRDTGEQHPACALLDELDDIHDYSPDRCRGGDPAGGDTGALNVEELTGFVRRTLKIVNAIPKLP